MKSSLLDELASLSRLERPSIALTSLGERRLHYALDEDRPTYPASMIKTPLVAAALLAVEGGFLRLEERRPVRPENATLNEAPSPIGPGYPASLEELCRYAIDRSDNIATNELFDRVDRVEATRLLHERLGLNGTAFHRKLSGADPLIEDPLWDRSHRNSHPAGDAARLFELISKRAFPNADLLESWLAQQRWNDKLSRGLEPEDSFFHKTGDTSEVTHDGGILLIEGFRYAIAVYTEMPSTPEHNERFGDFMRSLRQHALRDLR